ncbi:MAG: tetratricopeptide repeat protein [Henriciella sp.]|nr:tetratricopeptide repeat protein [Henriciella sp.]
MRSRRHDMLGAALGALMLSSCVSGEGADSDAPPPAFIDPLILSQNRCGGQATPTGAQDQTAALPLEASFDFETPFALPGKVIDHFHYPVTTKSADAQTWFDTGLAHMANFNHDEAIAAFREAQRLDPDCAMCFWGEGLAFGSNINASFAPARGAAGLIATREAAAKASSISEKEAALISALGARYRQNETGEVVEDAETYADRMDIVSRRYGNDKLILALAAEANMNTQPWDYWQAGARTPKGRTARTLELLDEALAIDPDFAPPIHLYIHATEASVDPFRAEAYADRLHAQDLGIGHIVHMPSHIYLRLGRWKKAIQANIDAIAADEAYIAESANGGFYGSVYYPHNVHFVIANAQLGGDASTALSMADKLSAIVTIDPASSSPFGERVAAAELFTLLQFGSAADVLEYETPSSAHLFAQMAWHHARGVAHARQGALDDARVELAALRALPEVEGFDAYAARGAPLPGLVEIATHVLEGRIAASEGDYAAAINALESAAATQEKLPYFEPAWWYFPARQSLGAYLLMDGQTDRAEREFFKTLIEWPNNAYALFGLAETYAAKGNDRSEAYARHLFNEAWLGGPDAPSLADL